MPLPADSLLRVPADSLIRWSDDSLYFFGYADSSTMERVDSLWHLPPADPDTIRAFLATGHGGLQLPPGMGLGQVMVRYPLHYDWIFWVFGLSLLFVTMIRFAFPRRFQQVMSSLVTERSLVGMLREGDLFTERIMLGLMTVFVSLSGLFLLMFLKATGLSSGWLPFQLTTWLWCGLGVLGWWMLRSVLIYLLGFVFKTFDATSLYLSRILAMNMAASVLLLALLPFAWYGGLGWVYDLILWVLLAINLYRIFRSLADGLRMTGFGLSYLLLFALTVEGLPLLLLAAWLRHNIL
ncbi:MAG TPA: DUF4271 domain-containing protein [Bacteroidales bacterium]|nr:DUF4271 domain-containing protein [Bacteroidales bacterium]HRZ76493.1 DUF4271 domain-containing protein [Bacteroidales bacterium]